MLISDFKALEQNSPVFVILFAQGDTQVYREQQPDMQIETLSSARTADSSNNIFIVLLYFVWLYGPVLEIVLLAS